MSNQWHYDLGGTQFGPEDEAEMIRLIEEGEIPPEVLVCKVGDSEWQPAWDHTCFQVEAHPIENLPVPSNHSEEAATEPSTDTPDDEEALGPEYIPTQDAQPPAAASNSKLNIGTAVLGLVALVATVLSFIFAYKHDSSLGEFARFKNRNAANQEAFRSQLDGLKSELSVKVGNLKTTMKERGDYKVKHDNVMRDLIGAQKLTDEISQAKNTAEQSYRALKARFDAELVPALNRLGGLEAEFNAQKQIASKLRAELASSKKKIKPKRPLMQDAPNKRVVKNVDPKFGFITIPLGEKDTKRGDILRVTRGGKTIGTIVVSAVRGANSYCQVDKTRTLGMDRNPLVGDIKPGDDVELYNLVPIPASVGPQPPTFPPGLTVPNPPLPNPTIRLPVVPVPSYPSLPKPITPALASKNVVREINENLGLITISISENDANEGDVYRVTRGDKFVGTIVVSTQKEGNSYCKVDKTQTTGMDKNPVTGDIKAGDIVERSSTVTALDTRLGFITVNYGPNEAKKGDVYRVLRAGKFVGIIWVHTNKGAHSLCKVDKVHTIGMDKNPRTGSIQVGDNVEPYR